MEIILKSINLIFSLNVELYEIIFLSLKVSITALIISVAIGTPISAVIAVNNFFGKKIIKVFF